MMPGASALIVRAMIGLALRLVYGGVGRRVDDQLWCDGAHGGGKRLGSREVGLEFARAVEVERNDRSQRRECALQLPADLTVLAEEQDSHDAALRPT